MAADHIEFPELATLIIGLIALLAGTRIRQMVPMLKRIDMPNAVIGAMIVALLVLLVQVMFGTEVAFGTKLRDLLLLVFFTTIGLSAKLKALRAGGRPLVILCAVTVLLLVFQNLAGIAVAAWGAHPFYGLLAGSLSFVGGPGTALAWAKEAEAVGLQNAQAVGAGAATVAVITGALVSGPITGWLIGRHKLSPVAALQTEVSFAEPQKEAPGASQEGRGNLESILATILIVAVSVFLGDKLNSWAKGAGLLLPGFLSAMLAGVFLTNLADWTRIRLDSDPIQKGGEVALNLFLVLSLMSTKLIAVAAILGPLFVNVLLQIVVIVAIAYFVLFRLLGRDYEAAVTVGGFLGFGISSMPVAMATMDEVARRYGPAPKAFLLITLAGSFFVDLANALVAKAFLALPLFDMNALGIAGR
ncbi:MULTISPECIES: sodium/glutamate symporter [unclassified Mesorhizobium]|uniref:sodium/glutamate symporter n=1 Tax=unclassified Mesorhizobium TaxID=325217 RepID=UPI000FCCB53B|nr:MULTISPECIES: sodium/glutamate symporter [unclassified Mesorhizobium]TGP24900.1 sodium/glutamate symporter [Mesorhizobium sp. M1D.F.Ca.ET.231.01.1.1]TGP36222.1 sodium/glutamate symporter [Mesorhizobium sp. M1D.F.Ca.ET.234.01.1.1]TGS49725.1 sodium/glutamate symporter [Mesorhizobium sp. M1D.F.Ca.ET.184.01.1.1]TGS64436.1 sodium/glutamate symporter [Mesorhizobium sp. M1D.F.Ca.ET.183.01.1.1]